MRPTPRSLLGCFLGRPPTDPGLGPLLSLVRRLCCFGHLTEGESLGTVLGWLPVMGESRPADCEGGVIPSAYWTEPLGAVLGSTMDRRGSLYRAK
jgi:hypothetical protein